MPHPAFEPWVKSLKPMNIRMTPAMSLDQNLSPMIADEKNPVPKAAMTP